MQINLAGLVGVDGARKLYSGQLHKIAREELRQQGYTVGDELDLKTVVAAIGAEMFKKNAEYKTIFEGLVALHDIDGE
jgi:hypothetical protein